MSLVSINKASSLDGYIKEQTGSQNSSISAIVLRINLLVVGIRALSESLNRSRKIRGTCSSLGVIALAIGLCSRFSKRNPSQCSIIQSPGIEFSLDPLVRKEQERLMNIWEKLQNPYQSTTTQFPEQHSLEPLVHKEQEKLMRIWENSETPANEEKESEQILAIRHERALREKSHNQTGLRKLVKTLGKQVEKAENQIKELQKKIEITRKENEKDSQLLKNIRQNLSESWHLVRQPGS